MDQPNNFQEQIKYKIDYMKIQMPIQLQAGFKEDIGMKSNLRP